MAVKKERLFAGFSTYNRRVGDFQLYDIDLIKQDLINHFYTKKGERVMLPEFGSIIWDLIFEPFTEEIRQEIEQDVVNIVNQEPRVELQNINVSEIELGLRLEVDLLFTPYDAVDTLVLDYSQQIDERS